jgi:hypothetical protein
MLALLKKLLGKQDHADLVSREAIDIIKRHQRFNEDQRREMMSAFDHAKARLEIENGDIQTWALQRKTTVANQTRQMAKDAYDFAPYGACGVALISLYLEAQTMRGAKAERLIYLIDEWHRRASDQAS